MPNTSFNVQISVKNPKLPEGMARRVSDLTPVWFDIMEEWAAGNVEKFSSAAGQELSGLQLDAGVFWQPVTSGYYRSKHGPVMRGHRTLYPDILMVKTGLLEQSLTSTDSFNQVVMPQKLIFGTPTNDQAYNEALWNWERRQTIFLGEDDRRMIENNIYQYLQGIGKYEPLIGQEAT